VKRSPLGAWCGYAGVPPGHRFHGADYDGDEGDGPAAERICHVGHPGEPGDVFWFGFDCCHYNDVAPGMLAIEYEYPRADRATYKTVDYARAETTSLARQLAGASTVHGGR
jgi:hypothetical protein